MQRWTLVLSFLFLEVAVRTTANFPPNLVPLNQFRNGELPSKVFTGDDVTPASRLRSVQLVKRMRILGEDKIMVAARENIYLIDPRKFALATDSGDVTYDSMITWKSSKENRDLCTIKGQPDELCYNFNSVFEALDEHGHEFLVCGTDSFNPNCTKYQAVRNGKGVVTLAHSGNGYFTGKQRCPYGPNQPSTSLFSDKSLYSGTFQAFSGGSPVILRTMGDHPSLRTPSGFETMNDPSFVAMAEDKERVFIFFNEKQTLPGGERRLVAQVAQVCKNDVGGDRVLTRMWTTFVKSRLNCSYNGFYFNELRDVTKPRMINGEYVVFATFATPSNSLPGSAVCAYSLDAIREALQGPFLHESESPSSTPPPESKRPGFCRDEDLSDAELLFIQSYPQMQRQAKGRLLFTNVGTRYTTTSVHTTAGPEGLTVFYVGSEDGTVTRRLAPMSKKWPLGAVISEQMVFDEKRCTVKTSGDDSQDKTIKKILIDPVNDVATVTFKQCIVSVPIHICFMHKCKSACIGSGDPYCGWNGSSCSNYSRPRPRLQQDVGNAIRTPEAFPPCETPGTKIDPSTGFPLEGEEAVKPKTSPTVTTDSEPEDKDVDVGPVPVGETELLGTGGYDLSVLAAAIIGTFVVTALLMLLFGVCLWKRYKRNRGDVVDSFRKKQLEQMQSEIDQDKRGSLGRKAQITYRGCLDWLCLPEKSSLATTPRMSNKTEHAIVSRHQNNYSEAPTLQHRVEQAKKQRRSSSRQSSTCSVSSSHQVPKVMRSDSMMSGGGRRMSNQPLLINNETYEPVTVYSDGTLQKHISEAPTLPHPNKRSSQASSGGSHSPISSNESHVGAAEIGILPTASTKMRRRNERAQNQTDEIMRESDVAIRDFQHALHQMEQTGIAMPQRPPSYVARQRLDSTDSGRGESPRNSLRTEFEQQQSSLVSPRNPRPTSLNLQRNTSSRRKRLHSEPCCSPDEASAFIVPVQRFNSMQPQVQATPNNRNSRSQPTTPIGAPHSKLSVFQPSAEQSIYATLPKNDPGANVRRSQRQSLDSGYHGMYMQRQPSNDVIKPRRDIVARPNGSPVKGGPPNRYPSLLVRGPYAAKTNTCQQQQRPHNASPPKNHYPSLPHRSSSAPFGTNNVNVNVNGFERPSTLHRREQLPSFMRQISAPGPVNRALYVPTPTVPTSDVHAL